MESSICAYNIQPIQCEKFKIQEINALDFQLTFMDLFASLAQSLKKPKIEIGFFDLPERLQLGIAVIPITINNLHTFESQKDLAFRFQLATSKTVKNEAYGDILLLVKICISITQNIAEKLGLTYLTNLVITNSSSATLTVNIKKRI